MNFVVYDKAAWHIDAGEDKQVVLNHFSFFMTWCLDNNILSDEGIELAELGIDDSISLHSRMFTEKGNIFMQRHYDTFISATEKDGCAMLAKLLEV